MASSRDIFAFSLRYQVRSGPNTDVGPAAMQRLNLAFERAHGQLRNAGSWIGPYVIEALRDFAERQFRGQGIGTNRGKWAALKPAYEAWKRRRYGSQPLLVRTGALRSSLVSKTDTTDSLRVITPSRITYGSRIQYGHYHQLGTVRMTDRPLFDFDERFERKLRAGVLKGVRDALRDAQVYGTSALDDRIRKDDGG
jgi:hypothetical protein